MQNKFPFYFFFFPEFLNLLEGADLSARADSLCSSPVKPREMCDIFVGVKSLDYLGFLVCFFFLQMRPFSASKT